MTHYEPQPQPGEKRTNGSASNRTGIDARSDPHARTATGAQTGSDLTEPLTPNLVRAAERTRPWVRAIATFGFVFAGFFFVGGIMVAMVPAEGQAAAAAVPPNVLMALVYIVIGALFLLPSIRLHRYGRDLSRVGEEGRTGLENAMLHQQAFWRTAGISLMVFLGLWLVLLLGAAGAFA